MSTAARERVPGFVRPYLRALWRPAPPALAVLPAGAARAVLAAGTLYLPRTVPADPAAARRLRFAISAHAGAHLEHGGPRFDRASLKPVQLALVGLLEDARVEWLAASALPGLRTLWLGYHQAGPESGSDFESLLARLARVLLDPGWHDPHPWVQKGRALFFADPEGRRLALRDAGDLRSVASRLGNDVGQMRLQFNARAYRVQPEYRDDNSHLWRFDEQLPASPLVLEASQEQSARADGAGDGESPPRDAPAGVGAEVAAPESARRPDDLEAADPCVFRYAEWDRLIGRHRPAWVTVLDARSTTAPASAAIQALRDRLADEAGLVRRLRQRLLQGGGLQGRVRPRRAPEGDGLHLPSVVDAVVARRMRSSPDPRLYLRPAPGVEPWAVTILVDASASTARAADLSGRSVLDQARMAALACALALESAGHACAIQAFASEGRHAVRVWRLKDFDQACADTSVLDCMAALDSALSTRIGAALRHAGALLAARAETTRCVLLLTDGEPHDIDVHDSRYLLEDLRIACGELRRRGLRVGCLNLDADAPPARRHAMRAAFAAGCYRDVASLQALPDASLAVLTGAPR